MSCNHAATLLMHSSLYPINRNVTVLQLEIVNLNKSEHTLYSFVRIESTLCGSVFLNDERTYGVESRLMLLACVDEADLWLVKAGRLGEA